MLTAIKRNARKEYIPECEKTSDNPTKFIVRGLTHSEMLEVNSILEVQKESDNKNLKIKNSTQTVMPVVKKGIVEIQNFESKNITEITDDLLETLSFDLIMELFSVIMNETKLSGAEEKN